MERQIQVRLKADLTRYHPGLTHGVEGYTIGAFGTWSRGSDRFVGVCFPGITTLDVLWEGLEIIDPARLAEIDEENAAREREWLRASNVVKHLGPNGGFKGLSYQSTTDDGGACGCTYGPLSRETAQEAEAFFRAHGIPIREVREPRQKPGARTDSWGFHF